MAKGITSLKRIKDVCWILAFDFDRVCLMLISKKKKEKKDQDER